MMAQSQAELSGWFSMFSRSLNPSLFLELRYHLASCLPNHPSNQPHVRTVAAFTQKQSQRVSTLFHLFSQPTAHTYSSPFIPPAFFFPFPTHSLIIRTLYKGEFYSPSREDGVRYSPFPSAQFSLGVVVC